MCIYIYIGAMRYSLGCMFISHLRALQRKRALGILVEQVLWIAHPFSLSIHQNLYFSFTAASNNAIYGWRDPALIFNYIPQCQLLISRSLSLFPRVQYWKTCGPFLREIKYGFFLICLVAAQRSKWFVWNIFHVSHKKHTAVLVVQPCYYIVESVDNQF
jgi:hypothetical protein